MLPVLATAPNEFDSPRAALDYVERRLLQRFTIQLADLSVDVTGKLRHQGVAALEQLQDVPLTDSALSHINSIVGISSGYAANIEPELHAHSVNELARREVSAATVVVEYDRVAEKRHVVAVLRGGRTGISDAVILGRIEARGLGALVSFVSGEMSITFGDAHFVEALPGDHFRIAAHLRNAHWGVERPTTRPALEVSAFLVRMICTNGAYARRTLAEGRVMAWASRRELDAVLDHHIDRVLGFRGELLERAVAQMSLAKPAERDREEYERLVTRSVGENTARAMLTDAAPSSVYDWFNVLTAGANRLQAEPRRRRLQVAGGALLDRYLPVAYAGHRTAPAEQANPASGG